ncbi:MAG: class I SAM-dependent methyltransferase [Candidatus Marinimicrobia bacterium]|nr:class I SAM-dependent methyltransferase [Candidatus Neomarinimicrobiota bacterium]
MRKKTANKIIEISSAGYDKIAEKFSQTRNYIWKEMEIAKTFIKNGFNVLDIGCGNGRFFETLKDKNINYTGIDNSEKLLEIARKKHNTNFIKADATSLPLEDEHFDTVVSFAVLHHIPSKELRNQFIKESFRVLKKDGYFIITVWNLWQKKYIPQIIKYAFLKIIGLSDLDFKDIYLNFGKEKNVRYLHAFTKQELKKLLTKNGFKIKKISVVKRGNGQKNFLVICKKN